MTTYSPETPISGPSTWDPDAVADYLTGQGATRPDDLREYTRELSRLCRAHGISFNLAIGQFVHETTDRDSLIPASSPPWTRSLNPAGIGVSDDSRWFWHTWPDGAAAARNHFLHLWEYDRGAPPPSGLTERDDVRWQAVQDAGSAGTVHTLRDLNGTWAIDRQNNYHGKIAEKMNALETALGGADPVPTEDQNMAASKNWYILNVSGHRSTGDGGSDIERQLTDDLAAAYTAEARRRGYPSDWWQRDLDKDSDPTMTIGSLDTVARGVGRAIGARKEPIVLMLDLHLNGRVSPVHSIVAHATGLSSPYAGGAPADDIPSNNPLDVAIAKGISAAISSQLGLTNFTAAQSKIGVAGVMSEQQTRVAIDFDARLAMMGGSAPYRMRAVRLVIEHAGSDQLTRVPNWAAKAASAALDAIDVIYAARNAGGESPAPEPTPDPDPETYPDPLVIPELAEYIQAGVLMKQPPPVVGDYIFTPNMYVAKVKTPRLLEAKADSVSVGPDLNAGQSFQGMFTVKAADGYYLVTGWWTRFKIADLGVLPKEGTV